MSFIAGATRFAERAPLPDALSKFGVAALVDRASRSLSAPSGTSEFEFARDMDLFPVAEHVSAARGR
jgi:cyclopropane-fatty-acyl-phospholipid synthase